MENKKLTDQDLNQILSEMESINIRQQQGSLSVEEALEQAYEARKLMTETLDRSLEEQSALRLKTWDTVKKAVSTFEKEKSAEDRAKGPRFPVDSFLDIEARAAVQETKTVIRNIRMSGTKVVPKDEKRYVPENVKVREDGSITDEEYALTRINKLTDFGTYIASKHPELEKLRQAYHDKCLDNYEKYAKDMTQRKKNRDLVILDKIKKNNAAGKYGNPSKAEAVMNLLQPMVPNQDSPEQ